MSWFAANHLRVDGPVDGVATLWLDVADKAVNAFDRAVLADLDAALSAVSRETSVQFLVLRSPKPSGFAAGADLRAFEAITTATEAAALSAAGQEVFGRLARLPVPTVAVVHGACLGGGLECALACDYRLVVDQPKTLLGLPEIELGLLPAWGGTQRLPRAVGLERSLKMILGRKRLNAREALHWGLADARASSDFAVDTELTGLIAVARRKGKRHHAGLPLRNWQQWLVESHPLGRFLIFRGTHRLLRQRTPDDMPAPAEALEAVRIGVREGIDAGLAAERAAVGRLALTPACRNLVGLTIHQLFHAKELPPQLRGVGTTPIRRVGVVGVGTMGAGIAQLAAVKGFEVVVHEVNEMSLEAGVRRIDQLFQKAVENRVLTTAEAAERRAAIRPTFEWTGFDSVDLVVEAVIEDLDAKRKVFAELETRVRPEVLLATNTSSLLVARLQEACGRPERVVGLHFFNPVHKMPLVEVVRGPATTDAATASLAQWAIALGKTPVVVKDSPGFLVNRILMPYLGEAVLLLGEPRGSVKHIDAAMKRFGMPMGPLELLDQVGIDVAAHIERSIRPVFGARFNAEAVFEGMCKRGWLGRKAGVGFYHYRGDRKRCENCHARAALPEAVRLDHSQIHKGGVRPTPPQWQRPELRMALLMVNEAAACLGEGLAADAATIDRAMILGVGWAPHRGGPLRYATDFGLPEVVRLLEQMAGFYGPRFDPCVELRRLAGGTPQCRRPNGPPMLNGEYRKEEQASGGSHAPGERP